MIKRNTDVHRKLYGVFMIAALFPAHLCASPGVENNSESMSRLTSLIPEQSHVIILSPHLDDGVWSCGGLISLLAQSGSTVDLITVYSGNPADTGLPKLQKAELRSKGSIETRKKEDLAALAILGANAVWWDFPTRLLRKPWLKNRLDVFQVPVGPTIMRESNYERLEAKVSDLIQTDSHAILLCPLGAGHMYDHVELFTACVTSGYRLGHLDKMFFYEDSYAILTGARKRHFLLKDRIWNRGSAPQNTSLWWRAMGMVMTRAASNSDIKTCIPEQLQNAKWAVATVEIASQFEKKMNSLAQYESQMSQFGGMRRVNKAFKKYHAYWNGCEAFWFVQHE